MSTLARKDIREFSYYLAKEGKFSVGRLVPDYCSEKEFHECFSERKIRELNVMSSKNRTVLGLSNLEIKVKLEMVKYYPARAFLEDIRTVLRNNEYDIDGNKLPNEAKVDHNHLREKCLEIADVFYKSGMNRLNDDKEEGERELKFLQSYLKSEMDI